MSRPAHTSTSSTRAPAAPAGYEQDFFRWARQQASLLRAQAELHGNAPLDWANLAEEVEGVALRDRRELGSRLKTIMEHLLKMQCSPAQHPRAGWMMTVSRERSDVAGILRQSPSLRRSVPALVRDWWPDARRHAALGLAQDRDHAPLPEDCSYTPAQLLDQGFWPPEPEP